MENTACMREAQRVAHLDEDAKVVLEEILGAVALARELGIPHHLAPL